MADVSLEFDFKCSGNVWNGTLRLVMIGGGILNAGFPLGTIMFYFYMTKINNEINRFNK